ncbi:MAG: sodium-dependent transporter [Pseudomonadota bacterium]
MASGTHADRGHWGSRLGFVLAAAGSAIGLGNIWKFPYITGENGGGLFVLIYLVCIVLVGLPIMIAEVLVGRATQSTPVGAFGQLKGAESGWKMVGWLGVASGFVILSYYSVVAGWACNYWLMSVCDFFRGKTPAEIDEIFGILYTAGDVNLFWHLAFMLMVLGIVIGGVKGGIERWSRILMPVMMALVLILALRAVLMPGFGQAIDFLFMPHADKLQPSSILEALGHAFFTLSVGMGAMLTYGSYLDRESNITVASAWITGLDTLIALTACVAIFPILFSFGMEPSAGPGLVFKTMPILFSQMTGGLLLAMLFFALLVFAALTSAISLLEVVAGTLIDLLGWSRTKATLLAAGAAFLFGVPSALAGSGDLFGTWEHMFGKNFFDTMDYLASNWMLPMGGLAIAIFVGWFLKPAMLRQELLEGTDVRRRGFWNGLFVAWLWILRVLVPVLVGIVLLNKIGVLPTELVNRLF